MRGRKPKPTYLKLIEGNPGGRPLNLDEPQPAGVLVDAPDTFTPEQRRLWNQELAKCPEGMLRKLDMAAFTIYVVNLFEFLMASKKVAELGPILRTKKNLPQVNPWLGIRHRANLALMKSITELGFSPSSRTRVKTVGGGKKGNKGRFGELKSFEF